MEPASLLLAALAGLGALTLARREARAARAWGWADSVATALGAAERIPDDKGAVRLRVGRHPVRCAALSPAGPVGDGETALELRIPAPLPPMLEMRPGGILRVSQTPAVRVGRGEVDTFYDVRAADPLWAGIALGDERVGDAIRPLRQHVGSVALSGGVLRLVVGRALSADELLPIAHRLVTLAEAVAAASVSAWTEGGRDRGLGLQVVGALALRLTGPRERVSLRFATSHPDAVGTQVLRVEVGGAFPEDVVLERRQPDDRPGRPLGDLILDRGLRALDGPPDLGHRLGRDAVRGPLLALLHGGDAARVAFGGIELRTRGGATPRLLERLDEVDAVARALEAAWR